LKRVTGIGGIFFKSSDSKEVSKWYEEHLGIPKLNGGSTAFQWRDKNDTDEVGYTVWSVFKDDTDYLDPSDSEFMINYRVEDLEGTDESIKRRGSRTVRRNTGI